MSNYFCCCYSCFEKIAQKNISASKIWLDLCATQSAMKNFVILKGDDFDELAYLEQNRYIITTETDKYVFIKALGHHFDKDGDDLYCINFKDHNDNK